MPDLSDRLPDEARSLAAPVLRWPDAILSGRAGGYPGDAKAAYVAGFNALGQGADTGKSARALASLEFSVCHEMFMTPTARMCDVVLPVLSPLEKEDACAPWHGNYLLYKRAALPPRGLARSDYDIFAELSDRLGLGDAFADGLTAAGWLDRLLAESEIGDLEAFKDSGVYFGADRERVGLAAFASDPESRPLPTPVITSYSIHYTKLYEYSAASTLRSARRSNAAVRRKGWARSDRTRPRAAPSPGPDRTASSALRSRASRTKVPAEGRLA